MNAVFQGKIYWFWGDTNRPDYPLGNFHVPGAVSELPGRGGLEPQTASIFPTSSMTKVSRRPTAPIPGEGPTWISGLTVLEDASGRERMFAFYAKIRKMLEVYERGLAEFNPETKRFEKVIKFPDPANLCRRASRRSSVSARGQRDQLRLLCKSVSALTHSRRPGSAQGSDGVRGLYLPGTGHAAGPAADSTAVAEGRLHYGWKTSTQLVRQDQQAKLIASRRITADESLLNLRDIDSGKTVQAHGGSVYWNDYRNRWVMITVESFGSTSALGEVWYAEADTPLGPWVYARKIVTHDKYSFYNPKQHPMFDKDHGRIIFFEGTYTTTFSGNDDPTPRYDYNQMMYQLDLSDPRLALPVAIYQVPAHGRGCLPALRLDDGDRGGLRCRRRSAFFAPDRDRGSRRLPVYEENDPESGQSLRVGPSGQPADPAAAGRCFSSFPPTSKTTRRQPRRCMSFRQREAPQGSIRPTRAVPKAARDGRPKCWAACGRTRRVWCCGKWGECCSEIGGRSVDAGWRRKIVRQSFFMLTIVQPCCPAASRALSSWPTRESRS